MLTPHVLTRLMVKIRKALVCGRDKDHVAGNLVQLAICHRLWRVSILERMDLEPLIWVESKVSTLYQ